MEHIFSSQVREHLQNHAQLKNNSTEFYHIVNSFNFILFQNECEISQQFKHKLMFYKCLHMVDHVPEIHKMFSS